MASSDPLQQPLRRVPGRRSPPRPRLPAAGAVAAVARRPGAGARRDGRPLSIGGPLDGRRSQPRATLRSRVAPLAQADGEALDATQSSLVGAGRPGPTTSEATGAHRGGAAWRSAGVRGGGGRARVPLSQERGNPNLRGEAMAAVDRRRPPGAAIASQAASSSTSAGPPDERPRPGARARERPPAAAAARGRVRRLTLGRGSSSAAATSTVAERYGAWSASSSMTFRHGCSADHSPLEREVRSRGRCAGRARRSGVSRRARRRRWRTGVANGATGCGRGEPRPRLPFSCEQQL